MMHLAKRLKAFPEYPFAQLSRLKKEVEEKDACTVIDLSIGSPNFPPSDIYIAKLKEYMGTPGRNLYPGYGATPQFSEGLIAWYRSRFHVALAQNELLPLLGAKDGVSHIAMALADEDSEILVPNPGYPGFTGPAHMMGIHVISYDLFPEDEFRLSIPEIEKKITSRTRMIWVNFPSNPTGQVASISELQRLLELCRKKKIWLIYDNAYAEITYNGYRAPSILEIPGAKDVAVEIGSFSKMYSFAGFRMGWIVGNHEVVAALAQLKSQFDSGLSLPLQDLAAYALLHPDKKWHTAMITQYDHNKNILIDIFTRLGLSIQMPKGALYLWARIPDSFSNSTEYAMNLLEKKHILVTPGSAFGSNGDRYVRICFSSDITDLPLGL